MWHGGRAQGHAGQHVGQHVVCFCCPGGNKQYEACKPVAVVSYTVSCMLHSGTSSFPRFHSAVCCALYVASYVRVSPVACLGGGAGKAAKSHGAPLHACVRVGVYVVCVHVRTCACVRMRVSVHIGGLVACKF